MKIGLLPLYVKLYDDKLPELRIRLEKFYNEIFEMFTARGITVIKSDFCRLKDEFCSAVSSFEKNDVDAIVTLHMAYSPSLESIEALSKTKLPIIVLDTTETLDFTNTQNPNEIMYNHGVHGVMDMCSMLTRYGKEYIIAAGHYKISPCIDEACGYVRAIVSANALKNSKIGLIGGLFDGMGDIQVPFSELKERFCVEVCELDSTTVSNYYNAVTKEEIDAEKKENAERFKFADNVIEEEYDKSVRSSLAVRKAVKENGFSSFSINFTRMGNESGLASMPFIECCKSLENGIGYAGEGDVLTASFVGALIKSYPETNFVEIFCPDWVNNALFLSHMGEVNYRVAAITPEISRVGVNYSPGEFPYVGYTRMKGGKGVYLNVCRGKDDFKLVLTEAEMVDYDSDNFDGSMRGWMKVNCDCGEFLKKYSQNGATHHSIFIYGATAEEIRYFGHLLNLETVII